MLGYSWRGGLNLRGFTRLCEDNGYRSIDVRRQYENDGFFWKHKRAYAYSIVCEPGTRKQFKDFGLTKQQAIGVISNTNAYSLAPLNLFAEQEFEPFKPRQIDAIVLRIAQKMEPYIQGMIQRKLAFLIQYWDVDRAELRSSLLQNTIQTLYGYFPEWRSPDDLMAIANSNLHNHAMNIIKHYTSEMRCPYAKIKGRIKIVVPNFSPEVDEDQFASDYAGGEASTRETDIIDAKISIDQIRRDTRLSPKHRQFICLITGVPDDEFSKFLGRPNDEWSADKDIDKQIGPISEFLGVKPASCRAFLSELRYLLS
jgi:hypothetical protein